MYKTHKLEKCLPSRIYNSTHLISHWNRQKTMTTTARAIDDLLRQCVSVWSSAGHHHHLMTPFVFHVMLLKYTYTGALDFNLSMTG